MNPIALEPAIREFDLFVTGGVNELPESVFDTDTRPAGEYTVVREQTHRSAARTYPIPRVVIGTIRFNTATGEVLDP